MRRLKEVLQKFWSKFSQEWDHAIEIQRRIEEQKSKSSTRFRGL